MMLSQRSLNHSHFFFLFCYFDWVIFVILSSRPLINSYVSPSLLLISSSAIFISVTVFFSFDWRIFIFSSSLLKSHCVLVFFPLIQLTFLSLMPWICIWYIVYFYFIVFCFVLFSLLLFQLKPFSVLCPWLAFSVPMKLDEKATYCVHGVFMWEHPYAVWVCPEALVGELIWCDHKSYLS